MQNMINFSRWFFSTGRQSYESPTAHKTFGPADTSTHMWVIMMDTNAIWPRIRVCSCRAEIVHGSES